MNRQYRADWYPGYPGPPDNLPYEGPPGPENWGGPNRGNDRVNPAGPGGRRGRNERNDRADLRPPIRPGGQGMRRNNPRPNEEDNRNRNGQQNRRGHRERPTRTMGFKFLENILKEEDIGKVVLDLSNDRSGFLQLLDSKEISPDIIVLLVKLFRNICGCTFGDVKIALLSSALDSRFMEKLTLYITNIMNQTTRDKSFNKKFWQDPDDFWESVLAFSKTIQELLSSKCEPIKTLLKNMSIFLGLIENAHSIHISDGIKAKTLSLLDIVEKTIADIEVRKQQAARHMVPEDELEPPNDFRGIEIIPSAEEIISEANPFLRANVVDKAYKNISHYLDIQFRLLREDFLSPLRRGITTFLRNQNKPKKEWKKLDDIKIYHPIMFLSAETANECNCYKLQFDFTKKKKTFTYENSKRFMFGSLVCFTNDNFRSVIFGKIVDRDKKLLEQSLLVVGFEQDVPIKFETEYLMVESTVYFEPYYRVLNVLKHMKTDSFPMERYIIQVEQDCRPPKYLLDQPAARFLIDRYSEYPLYLSAQRFYGLNDSQLAAFRAAITDEFCIIQGPPGTGKTFLGLKIAHTLLNNREVWFQNTPMLVICYTNHALDQFLEGLLPVTDKVLRVGGQSKNENLTKYNLAEKRRKSNQKAAAVHQKRREVRDLMESQKMLDHTLNEIDKSESILTFPCFKDVIENYENTWFATATSDKIKAWLLEGKNGNMVGARRRNQQGQLVEAAQSLNIADENDEAPEDIEVQGDQINAEWLDDIFTGIEIRSYRPLLSLQQLHDKLNSLYREAERLRQEPPVLNVMLNQEKIDEEIFDTESELDYLQNELKGYQDPRNRRLPRNVNLENPFSMVPPDRWNLYFYWLDKYARHIRQTRNDMAVKFRQVIRVYNQMRDIEDTQLMRDSLVIGITTTGAARLQSSLQKLRSPIVIVEEAAEVLEAHIVASLTDHCQHLILIGDHLQLKPGAADYRIETRFKLGISLFERMVNNKIRCHTLNVQHRMRPEISQLIKPHIYENLEDHETTLQRARILGVEKSLYFIDHQEPEDLCQDASKKNVHESKFLIGLARHLILNGYRPEQITILSAYLGQFFDMVREKKKPSNRMLLQDVRISVLDNYQGEESDIILLSLVRSNTENKAGFLKNQNRVCVALSRARDGFYIMGNMNLLLHCDSENGIWQKVNDVLKNQGAIGNHLALRCQIHRHKLTHVSKGQDFDKLSEGGCDLLCAAPLGCGHECKRLCHVQDRNHNLYKCNEKCTRILCNDPNHVCQKVCYENCGPCTYLVRRHLDCNHIVFLQCHINPTEYACKEPVLRKLPCDHETRVPCSMDPRIFRCPFPCDTRVEPCGHACERKCHIRIDPDHLEYRCKEPCEKMRKDCSNTQDPHKCTRLCFQDCEDCLVAVRKDRSCGHVYLKLACKENVEDIKCERPCTRTLPCGHPCRSKCFETCGLCKAKVEKIIPECQHRVKVLCHETPTRNKCKSLQCPRHLPCGHKCTLPCSRTCTAQCKEMVKCLIPSPCGHTVKTIMCYLRNTADPKILMKNCSEPCGTELKCSHSCLGTCGECMQGRIHVRCKEKCGVPLVCNHECPIPCRESCKPCTRPCEMKCKHTKCKKMCGEPCTPCAQQCERRCAHVQCKRKCGEICDVAPCEETCEKLLKCGHPCVGFCGDPCPPLCRECDKDQLTEIFFGDEDEEDAIFVYLNDCKHTFEHQGLENWLKQGDNAIQLKTCPKCKTNIKSTERYSHYVKESLNDVIRAKKMSYGEPNQNSKMRIELLQDIVRLEESCPQVLIKACRMLPQTIDTLRIRLGSARNQRRQPINKMELNAIKSKIQTLGYIIKCFNEIKLSVTNDDSVVHHMEMLLEVLQRSEDRITDQEIGDLESEINRFHRFAQFEKIKRSTQFRFARSSNAQVAQLADMLAQFLFSNERYTNMIDKSVKAILESLSKKVECALVITDQERMDIVGAMGLAKGHWYKCPNGHPYVITECGGAMQVAKCPECGAQIGGSNHHLLRTNTLATEMDGATRSAWPGGLY